MTFEFTIPFNAESEVILPDAPQGEVFINGEKPNVGTQQDSNVTLQLGSGNYRIEYQPSRSHIETLSTYVPAFKILQNKKAKKAVRRYIPLVAMLTKSMIAAMGDDSIRELNRRTPYLKLSEKDLDEIDDRLSQFPLKEENK